MNDIMRLLHILLAVCAFVLIAAPAEADLKGDINNDNKIDLVESIYALRVASQTTGAGFIADDLNGKDYYEVYENSSGNEICIIEYQYGPSSVTRKEWRYVNDDSWLEGCEEEYVPDNEPVSTYTINNGVIKIIMAKGNNSSEISLVERFTDNLLTSTINGVATWHFTRGKVNSTVDPKIKFTQDILSANYWYVVATYPDNPDNPDCIGQFDFDGNITLTVQRLDDGPLDEHTRAYALQNGILITQHDQKIETETISTNNAEEIKTIKTVLNENGTTDGTGAVIRWFTNRSGAEAFLNSMGKTICFPPADGTVKSAGRIWMDRNLGASRVATSPTDPEAYGDLYQWGRLTDGHEKRTSSTIYTLSPDDDPQHDNFILATAQPHDWRNPQNDKLWQGVSGITNPCPSGFRLPTDTELEKERASWSSSDSVGAFASPLKLVMSGFRNHDNGLLRSPGSHGTLWSSPVNDRDTRHLYFNSDGAGVNDTYRAAGFSVRCIKDY